MWFVRFVKDIYIIAVSVPLCVYLCVSCAWLLGYSFVSSLFCIIFLSISDDQKLWIWILNHKKKISKSIKKSFKIITFMKFLLFLPFNIWVQTYLLIFQQTTKKILNWTKDFLTKKTLLNYYLKFLYLLTCRSQSDKNQYKIAQRSGNSFCCCGGLKA